MAFTIKKGDTLPLLSVTLFDGNADEIDMSGADSVVLRVRKADQPNGADELETEFATDGSDGVVTVDMTDVAAVAGRYFGEFVIDWGGGDIQTVPSNDYTEIKVVNTLG